MGNAARLNDNDYELLRILIFIAATYTDKTALTVACHDIGEYVRHYKRGKSVLEELAKLGPSSFDGKSALMKLLDHDDDDVRSCALTAVSKLMVRNWEIIQKSSSNDFSI